MCERGGRRWTGWRTQRRRGGRWSLRALRPLCARPLFRPNAARARDGTFSYSLRHYKYLIRPAPGQPAVPTSKERRGGWSSSRVRGFTHVRVQSPLGAQTHFCSLAHFFILSSLNRTCLFTTGSCFMSCSLRVGRGALAGERRGLQCGRAVQ